ncbi:MAG TPA: hypothetical protein VJI74_02115 [Candidatus Paceibacterota bacterium]
MFQKYKKIILIVAAVVVAFILYTFFFTGGPPPTTSPLVTTENSISVGGDLVALLANLQSITLNGAIFTNKIFESLRDFGQDIPPQPVGRPNPFAPLP